MSLVAVGSEVLVNTATTNFQSAAAGGAQLVLQNVQLASPHTGWITVG